MDLSHHRYLPPVHRHRPDKAEALVCYCGVPYLQQDARAAPLLGERKGDEGCGHQQGGGLLHQGHEVKGRAQDQGQGEAEGYGRGPTHQGTVGRAADGLVSLAL